jgi:hypothetical protein
MRYAALLLLVAGVQSATPAAVETTPAASRDAWVAWNDWPGCTFYLPGDATPEPIEWEACPAQAGSACRRMSTPWQHGEEPALAVDVGFSVDASGVPRLLVERLSLGGDAYAEWVMGPADGDLDFAMRMPWPAEHPTCWALDRDLRGGRFALSLHGDGTSARTDIDGLLVGRAGAPPHVVLRDSSPGSNAWSIGDEFVVRNAYGRVTAHAHDGSGETLVYEPSMHPYGAPFDGHAEVVGDDIVFQVGDYTSAGVWAHDDSGTHPLIGDPADRTRGATNIGTDGKDLVWTAGSGRAEGAEGLYPEVSIMTAPFTTDPAALVPRRLRADMNPGIGTAELQFAVGCAYAGRPLADGTDVEIVRLRDGAAWRLRGSESWAWERVLGFTCDEVFLTTHGDAGIGVARVSLASLGEPM